MRRWGLIPHQLTRRQRRYAPYGPDGDEGDGCDDDLEEKLMRCVYYFFKYPSNVDDDICSLLYMYVSVHNGTFDDPEKNALTTFLEAR